MCFSPSSLLTISTIVTTSLFYQVNSLPVSPSDVSSPTDVTALDSSALVGRDSVWNKKIEKRSHSSSKHPKKAHNKKHTTTVKKRSTAKKLLVKKKSSSRKKTTTKKKKHIPDHTTHKKAAKKTSKKKKTTKKTTKKKTTKKTTKKSFSGGKGGTFSGEGTYYGPGMGSCGFISKDTDLIAALNGPQMHNGDNPNKNPICGRYANVHGPKGFVRVKIVDTCGGCKKGDLDFSPAAFGKIADFIAGRVPITWSWA